MVDIIEIIKNYQEYRFNKEYLLKEYFQYKILDIIFSGTYSEKLILIGGTYLWILYGTKRFSEDIDFDCFGLTRNEFFKLTDHVVNKLKAEGYEVVCIDKEKDKKLSCFRRNLHFPKLLYKMGLTGHKEKRFLVKIEAESQEYAYSHRIELIKKFDIIRKIKCAPLDIMLSMKFSAFFGRKKARDYFDIIYLVELTKPHYGFLKKRTGIKNIDELEVAVMKRCEEIDFSFQVKDVKHLLFNSDDEKNILMFPEIMKFSFNKWRKIKN